MNVSFRPFQPAFGKSPASEKCRQDIRESYAKCARIAPSEVPFEQELGSLENYLKANIQYAKEINDQIEATKEAIADCRIDIYNEKADKEHWEEMPAITYAGGSKQDELLFRLGRVRDRIKVERDAVQLKQLEQRELQLMRSIIENSGKSLSRGYGEHMPYREILEKDLNEILGQQ